MIPLTFNLKFKQLCFKKRIKKYCRRITRKRKKEFKIDFGKKRKKKQGKRQTITKLFTDFC